MKCRNCITYERRIYENGGDSLHQSAFLMSYTRDGLSFQLRSCFVRVWNGVITRIRPLLDLNFMLWFSIILHWGVFLVAALAQSYTLEMKRLVCIVMQT
ncbi:hypothetical protein BJX99DRAFT_226441 [Aspergillus californicus]